MNKTEIVEKVKGLPSYVKNNWNTPNEGEYLTLKEMLAYTLAQGGTYVFGCVAMYITFSASYFCGAVMGIATIDFSVINIISTILGYLCITILIVYNFKT